MELRFALRRCSLISRTNYMICRPWWRIGLSAAASPLTALRSFAVPQRVRLNRAPCQRRASALSVHHRISGMEHLVLHFIMTGDVRLRLTTARREPQAAKPRRGFQCRFGHGRTWFVLRGIGSLSSGKTPPSPGTFTVDPRFLWRPALPETRGVDRPRVPATQRQTLEGELHWRYVICMMREEERYWLKVSLTIGFVVLVLLLLLISGMIGNMKHIALTILEAVQ